MIASAISSGRARRDRLRRTGSPVALAVGATPNRLGHPRWASSELRFSVVCRGLHGHISGFKDICCESAAHSRYFHFREGLQVDTSRWTATRHGGGVARGGAPRGPGARGSAIVRRPGRGSIHNGAPEARDGTMPPRYTILIADD